MKKELHLVMASLAVGVLITIGRYACEEIPREKEGVIHQRQEQKILELQDRIDNINNASSINNEIAYRKRSFGNEKKSN